MRTRYYDARYCATTTVYGYRVAQLLLYVYESILRDKEIELEYGDN